MRGFLVLVGVLVLAAFVVAPPPQPADPVDPAQYEEGDPAEQGQEQTAEGQEEEQNVFTSVELAATNADLTIKLMKQALGVLLESSANAMESTEELLKSGVYSVKSIATGAQAAAQQIGLATEPPKQTAPPAPKKARSQRRSNWFW